MAMKTQVAEIMLVTTATKTQVAEITPEITAMKIQVAEITQKMEITRTRMVEIAPETTVMKTQVLETTQAMKTIRTQTVEIRMEAAPERTTRVMEARDLIRTTETMHLITDPLLTAARTQIQPIRIPMEAQMRTTISLNLLQKLVIQHHSDCWHPLQHSQAV